MGQNLMLFYDISCMITLTDFEDHGKRSQLPVVNKCVSGLTSEVEGMKQMLAASAECILIWCKQNNTCDCILQKMESFQLWLDEFW